MPHLDPLFRVFDHFVTEKLGGNESLDAVIQSGPHPNGLTWTRTAVKVVPHLKQGYKTEQNKTKTDQTLSCSSIKLSKVETSSVWYLAEFRKVILLAEGTLP